MLFGRLKASGVLYLYHLLGFYGLHTSPDVLCSWCTHIPFVTHTAVLRFWLFPYIQGVQFLNILRFFPYVMEYLSLSDYLYPVYLATVQMMTLFHNY